MVSVHRLVCASILLMTVCKTAVSFEISSLTIEPKSPICLEQEGNVTLSCIFHFNLSTVNFTRPFAHWSLTWYQDGEQLTNAITIHNPNNTIISRFEAKIAGLFTCVARNPTSLQRRSRSVSVEMRPNPVVDLISTPKFISDEDTLRYVMVSWLRESLGYVYSLFFQIDLHGCFFSPCVEDNIEPKCEGTKCTALIDTEGHDQSDLTFYIVTRQGACETKSRVWNYNLTLSSCGELQPKTLFYIPYPPTKLTVEASLRKVTLRWQDIVSWPPPTVSLTYTCSKTSTFQTIKRKPKIRVIRLSDKRIQGYAPYRKCTFCLSVQEYHCGQFSESLCRTTRLREERPSEAPKITCTNDTCPTSYDDQFRNLTVTWELPAEKYWGGVLREIKLRYLITTSNATGKDIVLTNLSSNSVVIKDLNKTLDYSVFLQACNNAGCSGYSNQLQVYRIRATTILATKSNSSNVTWYIVGSVVFLLVMVACLAVFTQLPFKQHTEPSNSLGPLFEPDNADYSDAGGESEYDQLEEDGSHRDKAQPKPSFV